MSGMPLKIPFLNRLLHRLIGAGDNHVAHNWSYADSTARGAATGFVTKDLYKVALQVSDNSLWLLTAITPVWTQIGATAGAGRELLTAARTYYVRTDGSDANNGLTNTAGGAFLTVQKAINVAAGLDTVVYNVTIQIADGTYTTPINLKGCVGAGGITIQGNAATPANVVISTTSASAFVGGATDTPYTIKDLKVQTTTSGACILGSGSCRIFFTNIVFGTSAGAHIYADGGAMITASGNYSITGSATVHIQIVRYGYVITQGRTVTLTGTPAFSVAYVYGSGPGHLLCGAMTFTGTATGTRYNIALLASIDTQTAGVTTYLPGNAVVTPTTGAQYV